MEKTSIQNIEIQVEDKADVNIENKISEMYRQIRSLNEIDKAIIFLFLEGKNHKEIAASFKRRDKTEHDQTKAKKSNHKMTGYGFK